jgi:glycosyltransferase involved in cell wall biosynthesis
MDVSVILSTYNAPDWLEKVIWGYSVQSYRRFELLIADDGSTEKTARLIRRLQRQTSLAIRHVWHEDLGFRKCTILNRAAEAASGDYLIFSDGDCIPRWDFVARHVESARARCLLSGGCVRLPMALSKRITVDDVIQRRATDPRWLFARGLRDRKWQLRLVSGGTLAQLLDVLTTTRATWNGCNASTWKRHVVEVNGYDERMGYGGLDRELGERLVNGGKRRGRPTWRCAGRPVAPRPFGRRTASAKSSRLRKGARRDRGSLFRTIASLRDGSTYGLALWDDHRPQRLPAI